MVWHAKPGCPPHHRQALERAVNAMPTAWREPPETGEVFEDIVTCQRRLRGFSLVEGFAIVKGSGSNKACPGQTFMCIFHGSKTRNTRNLEPIVERDIEDKIISQRERENTAVSQSNCHWEARVSYKSIGKRNSGVKGFVLTVKSLLHEGHQLTDDPLLFPINMRSLSEYQMLRTIATQHRQAIVSYQTSRRVIESMEEFGINLTARQYYNTVKNAKGDKNAPETIGGLLIALEEADFVYRTRVDIEEDNFGREIARKLVQIWFTHPILLEATRRFVADWLCVIDGTFNTNNLRMPILIAVGILNSGKTFPIAFSFCPSESEESYSFFWECLKSYCFEKEDEVTAAVPPRVILGDQAGGILASVPKAFPNAIVQICDWHAVQAMLTKFRRSGGYSKKDIDGCEENGVKYIGLRERAWAYIKSMSEKELTDNRQALLNQLKPVDCQYIKDV